jgi:hypothetical protein
MPDGDWTPLTPAQQRAKDEAAAGTATAQPPGGSPPPATIAGADATPPSGDGEGTEVAEITPAHLAEMRSKEEGFAGNLETRDGPTGTTPMPATPQEAITIIERLTNENLRLETERNAACDVVARYEKKYGSPPADES